MIIQLYKKYPRLFFIFFTPVAFIFIAVGIFILKNKVILPIFLSYEKQAALKQFEMVVQSVESQADQLNRLTAQWFYDKIVPAAFIDNQGTARLSSAVNDDALKTLSKISLVQILDDRHGILFSRDQNLDEMTNKMFKSFRESVETGGLEYRSGTKNTYWTIIPGPSGPPMIVSAVKYIKPEENKPSGFIFFGRLLDEGCFEQLKIHDDINIRLTLMPDTGQDTANSHETGDTAPQVKQAKNKIYMSSIFRHESGRPLLEIRIEMVRHIQGPVNSAARFVSISILAVAVCMWLYFVIAFLISHQHVSRQKKQIEVMLGQTKDHFYKVFQSRAVLISISTLKEGRFIDVNMEYLNALGYEKEEIIGKTSMELGAFADDQERIAFIKEIEDNGYIRDFDLQLMTKNNTIIFTSISADIIELENEKCILSVLIDITDRKRLEKELRDSMFKASQMTADAEIKNYQLELEIQQRGRAEKLNQVLFDISNTVNTTRNLDDLYANIHSILGSVLTLENFFIALYNPKKDSVTFPYWRDKVDKEIEEIIGISKRNSYTIEIIKSGKPLFMTKKKALEDERYKTQEFIGTLSEVWMGVPLKIKGEVIGVIATQSYSDPERFTPKDINILETASGQIALAIERKKAQQELLRSEIKHRSIIESVKDGYCETDVNGNIVYHNAALCTITGYSGNELMQTSFTRLAADMKQVKKVLSDRKGDAQETDLVINQKNGMIKHVGIRPEAIRDEEGQITGYRTFVRDIDEQKKYENELVFMAFHDALTGLYNRKAFYEYLDRCIKTAKRNQTRLAVLFMDIDKFKTVNDTLGHEIGDELLKTIAARLKDNLRETDYISRIGGDEFTVIMTNDTSFHPGKLARKLVNAINFPYDLGGHAVDYVSTSIGISLFPDDSTDEDELIKLADQAMYEAKKTRNTYVFVKDIE